ncbi:MAG: gliding motility protein GldN [Sphingobacteriia bacterium]|nr:MAG: gliding motility protein GldN [Sphingobacteriia bacterium]
MKKHWIQLVCVVLALAHLGTATAQSKYKTGGGGNKPAVAGSTQGGAGKPAPAKAAPKTTTGSKYKTGNTTAAAADTTPSAPAGGSKYLNPGNTAVQQTPSANNGSVTVSYDTTIQGGFDAKPEISLRPNYVAKDRTTRDRKPLPYEDLREDDWLYSHFVWREIDAREKINQSFIYPGKDDNGDQRFFSILLNAIRNDSVVAFGPENDRFTTPLTINQVMALTGGAFDTVDVPDPVSGAVERVITKRPKFSPDSVYTFRIKEQVVFDKEASALFTRIIAIAPIAKQVVAGKSMPRLLFWVYYPDLRASLAKAEVYNPKNFAARMTWEELFETRFFSSYIIKSTLNNPTEKSLMALIKDPLFRLLEGENIKQRIFNWEQDQWAY